MRLTGTGLFIDQERRPEQAGDGERLGLTGADAGNYLLSSSSALTTATINRASLSASVLGVDKTYDGTAAASFTDSLSGVLGDDVVRLTGTGVFVDKNAGLNKQVTVSGLGLTGADAGNYMLSSSSALTTATINRASLSASVLGVDKTYDGTVAASFTDSLSGVLGNDVVRLTGTGVFVDKNAGRKAGDGERARPDGRRCRQLLLSSSGLTTATINRASLSASVLGVDKPDGTAAASFTDEADGHGSIRRQERRPEQAGDGERARPDRARMPATTCCRRPRP